MELLWMLGFAMVLLVTGYGMGLMRYHEQEAQQIHERMKRGQWGVRR